VYIDSTTVAEDSGGRFVGHRRRRLRVRLGHIDSRNGVRRDGCSGGSTSSRGDEDGLYADCEGCHVYSGVEGNCSRSRGCVTLDGVREQETGQRCEGRVVYILTA